MPLWCELRVCAFEARFASTSTSAGGKLWRVADFADPTSSWLSGLRVNCKTLNRDAGHNTPDGKFVKTGEGAHIYAASPGGARYNPKMSEEDRHDAAKNGIYLCRNCHKVVDSKLTEAQFSAELLFEWKKKAEQDSDARVSDLQNALSSLSINRATVQAATFTAIHRTDDPHDSSVGAFFQCSTCSNTRVAHGFDLLRHKAEPTRSHYELPEGAQSDSCCNARGFGTSAQG